MKESVKVGLNFGLTSGVITTLGLMVGLHAGTKSTLAVIGGILTIAVADAMSDALGIHVSKESENVYSEKQIWIATIVTFLAKFVMAATFIFPVLFLSLGTAIIVGIFWGLSVLTFLSYQLAKEQQTAPLKVIGEHLFIAVLVITITHYIGDLVATHFH